MSPLRWYLASYIALLVPSGMATVIYPWLVVVLLHEPADRVGLAQMAAQLPALVFILFGGVFGDRLDQRRMVIWMHILTSAATFAMAFAIAAGQLTYAYLLTFAVVAGAIGTLAQPARDALLTRVAGAEVQRAITMMVALQFGVQIIGFLLGGAADKLGAVTLLSIQAVVMGSGAYAAFKMRVDPLPPTARSTTPVWREIADGVALAFRSARSGPAIVLTAIVGVFFAPTFVVLLPLMVRDIYAGSAAELSIVFATNMVGTVFVTLYLVMRGGIHHQGRAIMLALLAGCAILSLLAFGMPYYAFVAVIFAWGLGTGITLSIGRTIVQEATPPEFQARVLSVYALGLLGGMPIGSLLMGYAIELLGLQEAVWIPVIGGVTTLLLVFLRTDFWVLTAMAPTPVPQPEPA